MSPSCEVAVDPAVTPTRIVAPRRIAPAPKAAKARRALRSNPSQAREEAALRMWMASLGLGLESLSSLYEDCRDGVAFLRLVDFIKPGTIDWSRVLLEPRSIYERVQNCNHAVRAARFLGLVVEGFSGMDFNNLEN